MSEQHVPGILGPKGYYVSLSGGYANLVVGPEGLPVGTPPSEFKYDTEGVSSWSPFFTWEETPTNLLMGMITSLIIEWFPGNVDLMNRTITELKDAVSNLSIEVESVSKQVAESVPVSLQLNLPFATSDTDGGNS